MKGEQARIKFWIEHYNWNNQKISSFDSSQFKDKEDGKAYLKSHIVELNIYVDKLNQLGIYSYQKQS